MILRLGLSTALHGAAGVAMGVTAVLAACTLAQSAAFAAKRGGLVGRPAGSPFAPPRPGFRNNDAEP